ncbi:glycoside hydrolase family 3 protein [bacterium]|nr:MAG: glycoside hydrolase family 3 protein [bacterium]
MSISLEKLVGSTLILGFRGSSIEQNPSIVEQIKEFGLAGVILFDKDMVQNEPVHNIKSPDQVKKLCADLQSVSEAPLFISIDQEGGVVNRLKADYGFPTTRSHQTLGKLDNLDETLEEGQLIGQTLANAGINLNFAPCVDVDTNLENPIIHGKQRSFSSDPIKVYEHAEAYIKGLNQYDVLAGIKHFPGHGSSFGDTHLGFTDVSETWNDLELIPYDMLFNTGYDQVVMSSHIFNRHLDPDHPSTLSKTVLTGMLREKYGFKGLIISDDLQMGAITEKYGLETAIPLALNAGVNMICLGNNLAKQPKDAKQVLDIIKRAIDKGDLSIKTLEDNYFRIKDFKNKYLKQ